MAVLERGLAAAQAVGSGVAEAENQVDLAMAYAEAGRPLDSVDLLLEGVVAYRRTGAWLQVHDMFLASFRALASLKRFDTACIVAADMSSGETTEDWNEYFMPGLPMATVREPLGAAEVDRLIAAGRHRSVKQAIAEVENVLVEVRDAATT